VLPAALRGQAARPRCEVRPLDRVPRALKYRPGHRDGMAKKKKLDDLDAELAALEAELAALEGKAAPSKAPNKAPASVAPAPSPGPDAAVVRGRAPAEPAATKRRISFGKKAPGVADRDVAPAGGAAAKLKLPFGRKKGDTGGVPSAAAHGPEGPSAVTVPVKTPQAPAPSVAEPLPKGDLTNWRQEGGVWIRAIPGYEGPVVRRVLDEEGATVREERATRADLDEVTGVKAERGVGKLLGGASGAAAKLKGLKFGRKGGSA
jgi:hypothetical protein